MRLPSDTTVRGKAARWMETLMLVPSAVVLVLFLWRWASPTASIPAWGKTFMWLSPILVIYSFCILVVFVRRRNPIWIKAIEIAIVLLPLVPLIVVAVVVIRAYCGDIMPVPAD